MVRNKGAKASNSAAPQNIVFFHPDLGIGGAERLIVDAAVGLQERGHKVTIFTSYCDPNHCFEEARDGTLNVRVRGNTIFPSSILGRFHILLATLRQLHLVLQISLFTHELSDLQPSCFLVDQLSACLPLLRWIWPTQRIQFYCHFPDQLLVKHERQGIIGLIKKVYRSFFDWFEKWTMTAADSVIVNSEFTKSVVAEILGKEIAEEAQVIYPCVDTSVRSVREERTKLWEGKKLFLSINRFEGKKGVDLAIRAFHGLTQQEREQSRLIIAGGYDPRIPENFRCHKDLVSLAESLGLTTATATTMPTALAISSDIQVMFLLSIPSSFKTTLLSSASLLLYTPQNEHFGIVPCEAMYACLPVLAATTGGPLETVVDGQTGWLRDVEDAEAWTVILRKVLGGLSTEELSAMGKAGQKRVEKLFSRKVMAQRFEEELQAMQDSKTRKRFIGLQDMFRAIGLVGMLITGLAAFIFQGPFSRKS